MIGPYDGVSRPGFENMVAQFQSAGLDVQSTPNINNVIWKKLSANVSTNIVAALTGLTGGIAVKHEQSVKIIEALSRELSQVAKAKGIDTQGRIARVQVELTQDDKVVAEVSEMVFLRSQ